MKISISRRGFGKTLGAGVMGGLVAQSAALAADQPGTSAVRMTTRLRELIKRPGIVAAPGIYDPISARIAESLGFEALGSTTMWARNIRFRRKKCWQKFATP